MYTIKVSVQRSTIDGNGVFAGEAIKKGTIVWLFNSTKDLSVTQAEFAEFDDAKKEWFYHSAYLSPWTGLWICPPKDDASNYTNHSVDNNLTVRYDASVSSEPYFVANRDIAEGEEITNNYYEFDEITRTQKPDWATNA